MTNCSTEVYLLAGEGLVSGDLLAAGEGLASAFGVAFASAGEPLGEAVALAAGEPVGELLGDAAGDALGEPVGLADAFGVAAGAGCSLVVSITERVPRTEGRDKSNADNIKQAAAPMVIFAKSVCVPRAPKAVVETPLENRAPASALPGWSKTAVTNTMQERMNRPYKM